MGWQPHSTNALRLLLGLELGHQRVDSSNKLPVQRYGIRVLGCAEKEPQSIHPNRYEFAA